MDTKRESGLSHILHPSDPMLLGEEIQLFLADGGTLQDIFGFSGELMDAKYELAYDHFQRKEYPLAIAELSYLTNINPYIKKYWQALAAAQIQSKLYSDSLNSYSAAALLEPTDPIPQLYMGIACVQMNQFSEGVDYFEKSIQLAKEKHEYSEIEETSRRWIRDLTGGQSNGL